jgi:hypothetical protein
MLTLTDWRTVGWQYLTFQHPQNPALISTDLVQCRQNAIWKIPVLLLLPMMARETGQCDTSQLSNFRA